MSMLNTAPNKRGKYNQGLFIPTNTNKCIKLNNLGGFYYRSGLEHKLMVYFDRRNDIIVWTAELIEVPYVKKTWDDKLGNYKTSTHTYYPDFYYEQKLKDGTTLKVVAEVKPHKETMPPVLPNNPTRRQLENCEYDLKEYQKNLNKWNYCIEWCNTKGFKFILITEETFKNYEI